MRPTERFSNRADDYARYRPSYPPAVFDVIDAYVTRRALPPVAAEVGSGTGLFTGGLLDRGWAVHAIEPNARMRAAAEQVLATHTRFLSSAAVAEATGLPDASVSMVAAAQAFHWFDPDRCAVEWRRVLAPRGFVCLVWNVRRLGTPFMDAYEALLTSRLPEYRQITRRHADADDLGRFLTGGLETTSVAHRQAFDWNGLVGRVLSSSYAPTSADPAHEPLFTQLRTVFDAHQREDRVEFLYDATVTLGTF